MSNKPFKSSSHNTPCEWKSKVQTINNVDVTVYEPVVTTTPVIVSTPSLSVGTDPTFNVDKIKQTVDEILADNINAPITCQALLDSANTAVFASIDPINGYHKLPPSGQKIHEHFSSGNITEIKTSGDIITTGGDVGVGTNAPDEKLHVVGNIKATGTLEAHANSATAASQIGNAKIGAVSGGSPDVYFSNAARHSSTDFGLRMSSGGQTVLNSKSGQNTYFTINNQSKMMIKSDGNVGINTTNPGEKLEVNGNIKASGSLEAAKDTQSTSFLGKAKISHIGDAASFSHHNFGALQNYALLQNDLGQTVINGAANQFIAFRIDNGDKMRLMSDGKFGIGTTNPSKLLDVVGGDIRTDSSVISKGVIYTSTASTKEWKIYQIANGNLHFAFNSGNGTFSDKGYLNQAVNVNDIDFTGQHRSKFDGAYTAELVGLIVESTGNYLQLDGSVMPKIDEALPCVKLTSAAMSKRVFGVLSGIEGETREYGSGFVSVVPKDDGVTRVVVNSVGEGSLWVINTRDQALQNGDYVCSSSVPGYGERQEDDLLHSYTVAKITMDVDWSNLPDWLETRRVTSSGEVSETGEFIAAFVGVTYHCG